VTAIRSAILTARRGATGRKDANLVTRVLSKPTDEIALLRELGVGRR